MNGGRVVVLLLAALLCACAQGASVEQVRAFTEVNQSYGIRDAVQFSVTNTSKTRLLYWISLEQRQGNDWGTVYSSLTAFRDDMSEPVFAWIAPGETQAVSFVPSDNSRFVLLHQRNTSREYRLVLWVAERKEDMARAHRQLSRTFQVR